MIININRVHSALKKETSQGRNRKPTRGTKRPVRTRLYYDHIHALGRVPAEGMPDKGLPEEIIYQQMDGLPFSAENLASGRIQA